MTNALRCQGCGSVPTEAKQPFVRGVTTEDSDECLCAACVLKLCKQHGFKPLMICQRTSIANQLAVMATEEMLADLSPFRAVGMLPFIEPPTGLESFECITEQGGPHDGERFVLIMARGTEEELEKIKQDFLETEEGK